MRRTAHLLLLVLGITGTLSARARAETQIYWDNDTDAFVPGPGNFDRNYSEGLRVNQFAAPDVLPSPVRAMAAHLPGFRAADAERGFGVSTGQEIYTPDALSRTTPIRDDRPYAGYLYVAGILTSRETNVMRSLEVQVGTTGHAAHADDVQRWWHHALSIRRPRGWQHQLRGEPCLVVSYQERRRPWGVRCFADLVPHYGATVGNVHTEANAGATLRLGVPLPDDFGPWRNAPAVPRHGRAGLDFFARAEGRAVARNLFLDGNTFAPSLRVHHLPLLVQAQLGGDARWHGLLFRYTFTYLSREYRERPYTQKYGSFTIAL
jgi:lipid A 3-O-deacylase